MKSLLLILLMLPRVQNLDDWTSFDKISSQTARIVLEKPEKETERACQVACGDNGLCQAISYTSPNCILLGEETADVGCTKMYQVSTKSEISRDRTDMTAELGIDPCVSELVPATITAGRGSVCPRDTRSLVIRAVNETGARVTFDNDIGNVLSFDGERNMWQLSFPVTGFSAWLVAVTCAVTTTDTCPCTTLPMIDAGRGIENGVPAQAPGPCEDRTHVLAYWGVKNQLGLEIAFMGTEDTTNYQLACQAGIWLLTHVDNSDGWQVMNATCAPPVAA